MKYPDMDKIYRSLPRDSLPWDVATPPAALVELVDSGKVRPCRAIDFGCGTGNYALYLASRGFDVTGVDISPTAIRIAMDRAKEKGARCRFITADVLGDLHEINETFDFAFDWELLHHIFPKDRKTYIRHIHQVLTTGGLVFSVCFSEEDPQFGGRGKYRRTRIGTTLYFSSEAEIRNLFSDHFTIRELGTIDIYGKAGPHRAIRVLAERR